VLAVFAATLALGSGVSGTVVIDPARPVCQVGQSCSAPDVHDTLSFWRGTTLVAKARTSATGTFRVALAPGLYRITFAKRSIVKPPPPTVRVRRGGYVLVHLSIDIGIR
jgi:hypothetical protein